ncbi:TIGR03936 family radical SAM-associated protein [Anaerobium acetethylicum]|uniref:Radical SAM-linked protein n=1 Tax=Anaerobium acetethylicum TaxID=1619234 RepID=A0A1D3TNT1_9FIRM|nr:TIGR03936 family radical SAM-associated protein [Anaerobium acetethylicum]SCP94983.1 radical SAM-linked protein [Anaerobium acetethylicum]
MKIRIKFEKTGVMKFIGHLDIMRYFQKAMRRAEIDIAYSEGFSPHQVMSFAAPLGVGLTSEGEYLDIEVGMCLSSADAINRLNAVMVDGMKVLTFKKLPDDSGNAMSIVAAADYRVMFREGSSLIPDVELEAKLAEFYNRNEIVILKKTKKSEKEVDIKPMVYSLSAKDGVISMQLATGSVNNLKPELLMEAFAAYLGKELGEFAIMVHRVDVYADLGDENNRELVSLGDLGEDIA